MTLSLAILSDPHYAGAAEQARGNDYEFVGIRNPLRRAVLHTYRHFVWMRRPLNQAPQLERFLREAPETDLVIANGDYSCSSGFIGLADDAAFASAQECIGKLRAKFGDRLKLTFGDHELGKLSFVGLQGGMRLKSWQRCVNELNIEPFWKVERGRYVLIGVASSLIALPLFGSDMLPGEKSEWEKLRAQHLEVIRAEFARIAPDRRILLFCHDPTALPFLWREPAVHAKVPQIEQTIIGHLHSNLYLWKSRMLAGMPVIKFLGPMPKKLSGALNEAKLWRPFHVRLCPSLSGIELLKDGGYYTVQLDTDAQRPAQFEFHPLKR